MNKCDFLFTEDGSVGLYNNEVKDVYHSIYGAHKEAMEKFVLPSFSNKILSNKKEINILDICYGIGYNTKCALEFVDNNKKIIIDALEIDKELVQISPFLKDGIQNDELKIFILYQLLINNFLIEDIIQIMSKFKFEFFNENIVNFMKFLLNEGYKYNQKDSYNSFLHNIYYNYISNITNNDPKDNKYSNSYIKFHFDDARRSILNLKNEYDIVFLDAFSSQKDPTLWTIHFLDCVKNKMNKNSILVSYSKATPFRSALLELGFYVGKTFIDNQDMGTIASLNKDNILSALSSYDLELISTRSGITFKDENLSLSPSIILYNRELEQKSSERISHTAFLKKYRK